jgi:hypothetical protein
VTAALLTYHQVCQTILTTLRSRLLQSLSLSLPSAPSSLLLSIIDTSPLTASSLSAFPSGTEPGAVWMRLQRRYIDVRELDGLIVAMHDGREETQLAELEAVVERMRELGLEAPDLQQQR